MNRSKIEGDNNIVIQDSFNKNKEHRAKRNYQVIAIRIAVASLLVAIIANWDKIISFIRDIVS